MSAIDDYVDHNAEYALTHVGGRPARPARHVAVVACMDSRLRIFPMLGMGDGEAHVIRNAGGVVTDDVVQVAGDQPAAARHPGDHAHPSHRLRPAEDHRRRVQGRDRGGDRDQAALGR